MTSEALPPSLRAAILDDLETGAVLEATRWLDGETHETRRAAALALQRLLVDHPWDPLGAGIASADRQQDALGRLLEILRGEPGWTADEATSAVDVLGHRTKLYASATAGIEFALAVCEHAAATARDSDLRRALEGLLGAIEEPNALDEVTNAMVGARLRRLLPDITAEDALLAPLSCGDRFGPRARRALRRAGASEPDGTVLEDLRGIDVRKPDKWLAEWTARPAGVAEAERLVRLLLETAVATDLGGTGLVDTNTRILTAACYAAAVGRYPWAAEVLGRVADWGLAWVLGQGVAPRIARAAIDSLGHLGTEGAVLALLGVDKRYGSRKPVRAQLDAAQALTVRALGRTPEQVADQSVADAGLDADARQRLIPVGDCTAVLRLDGLVPVLRWRNKRERETATPPSSARDNHPAGVGDAKRLLRELREAITTQASRIESALVSERKWPVAEWADTFLRHPVLAALAERTIWSVSTSSTVDVGLAMPSERSLATLEGTVPLPAAGEVHVWHPMSACPTEVARWRAFVLDEGLDQPARQALRETYARDASVLAQLTEPLFVAGQLEALMRSSGWKVGALGGWEHGDRAFASKTSSADDLRVGVWIAGADAERGGARFGPTYCTLTSIQFEQPLTDVDGHAVRIDEVPAVFFSEALRDLDLFSSVAAVGAALPEDLDDPVAWAFWSAAAFSPLNASGEIRRTVVAHLLPKWPFAGRAEISDRWLVISGPQTYRVHFGTGQVLAGDSPMQVAQLTPPKSSRIALPIEDRRLRQIVDAATVLAAGSTESR